MERKNICPESGLKASMWSHNDFEAFECYEKGNANTRRDAETCLQEYAPRFKWSKNSRVLEFGSGDGSVTSIVAKYIPKDCELVGSDINENVIKYASKKYGNEQIKFIQFDVVGRVPEDMKGKFDHVLAMYLFHWVRDHETAFTNVYSILPKNGEFFTIFLAYCDIYSVFQILAKRKRWAQWMKNIDQFTSPYHESKDPDVSVVKILKKIGFETVDVKCRQRFFIHPIDDFRALVTGISPFDVPKNLWSDFVDDYIEVKRYMNLVDDIKGTVRTNYNLLIVHCTK